MTKVTRTAVTIGIWFASISSAAALTYVLNRPVVPPERAEEVTASESERAPVAVEYRPAAPPAILATDEQGAVDTPNQSRPSRVDAASEASSRHLRDAMLGLEAARYRTGRSGRSLLRMTKPWARSTAVLLGRFRRYSESRARALRHRRGSLRPSMPSRTRRRSPSSSTLPSITGAYRSTPRTTSCESGSDAPAGVKPRCASARCRVRSCRARWRRLGPAIC